MEEKLKCLIYKNGPQDLIDFAMHEVHIANIALHSNNCIQDTGLTGDARGNLLTEDPQLGHSPQHSSVGEQ